MSTRAAVFLGVIVLVVLYGVFVYNALVQLKHAVAKAWANIDVLLKQRHDELPKLVEVCRQYRDFEAATLERVIAARNQVQAASSKQDIGALGEAEGALRAGLGRLFAVAEAYPDLKANENFLQLQARITTLENGIADRRELYNESVNIFNVRIEQFPDLVIARIFGFQSAGLLEFASHEKSDVDIAALFKG
ncbi:LemA family protein [Viridibacterium curvum]|uniref:LemA family protein n=1 Tax=Viridibacterium curvum TaxID=1101404 RepID=A0ABP9QES2_9RHOO